MFDKKEIRSISLYKINGRNMHNMWSAFQLSIVQIYIKLDQSGNISVIQCNNLNTISIRNVFFNNEFKNIFQLFYKCLAEFIVRMSNVRYDFFNLYYELKLLFYICACTYLELFTIYMFLGNQANCNRTYTKSSGRTGDTGTCTLMYRI